MSLRTAMAAEKRLYRRLYSHARPYRRRLVAGAICCLVFAGSTTGLVLAARRFFERVFNPLERSALEVTATAAVLVLLGVLRGAGDFAGRYLIKWVGNRVVMGLRVALFDHLAQLPVAFFTKSRLGELISRLSNDTALVEYAVAQVVTDVFKQPVVLLGAIGTLFWLDARLALAMLIVFPVCLVPITLFGRRVRRASRQAQERLAELLSIAQEAIAGVRILKAFQLEELIRARFQGQAHEVFRRQMQVARARAAIEPIVVQLGILGVCLVMFYAWWVRMPIDRFFAFSLALMLLYDPVKRLAAIHVSLQQSSAAAERIFQILDTPVTIVESRSAVPLEPPIRSIEFDHVWFDYGEGPVLRDICLTIPAGRRVALVGPSGSGKTTLISLLPRFFDVTRGRILINGRDIRDYTLASLRRSIALVTQETVLFHDTVAHNIGYGDPEKPREAIVEAARRAHADEFIRNLPDGYDTVIGERGVRLSGGERQRLAIARALLRDAPILILDEATSALDAESERLVQSAVTELMADRTVLIIAHRLSTVLGADEILVLVNGEIVERGTHPQLMATNGTYRRLCELQFQP